MQACFEHFARDGRGGRPAGAVFDEQHADGDVGVKGGREGGEPGVGVGGIGRGSLTALRAGFF